MENADYIDIVVVGNLQSLGKDSSLKPLKHHLVTFYVLNNNLFNSKVASSCVPDTFFHFLQ